MSGVRRVLARQPRSLVTLWGFLALFLLAFASGLTAGVVIFYFWATRWRSDD